MTSIRFCFLPSRHRQTVQVEEDLVESVNNIRKVLPFDTIKSASILGLERSYQTIYDNRDIYTNLVRHFGEAEFSREFCYPA